MSAEQGAGEVGGSPPAQVEAGEQEAPVLPVSQMSAPAAGPRPGDSAEDGAPSSAANSSVSTQTEPPPRGVSDLWGLDEEIDKWQVSAMPEEKHYFSMDPNLIRAAITAVKSRLTEPDGNVRGTWLLTEVDHWDLEKERLVILTDNNLISVRYNFIHGVVEEMKFIPLAAVTNIIFGDFQYPSSYAYSRKGKALKIFWGKEESVGFFDRWNPFSSRVPYTIFASHLMLRKGRVDSDQLRVSKVIPELEKAINDIRKVHHQQSQQEEQPDEASASSSSTPEEYRVKEEDIVISSYVGLGALVHNDSNLGFFKRRGLMNW
jgi:hypothetical protein